MYKRQEGATGLFLPLLLSRPLFSPSLSSYADLVYVSILRITVNVVLVVERRIVKVNLAGSVAKRARSMASLSLLSAALVIAIVPGR